MSRLYSVPKRSTDQNVPDYIQERRRDVFLVLAGFFLAAMVMLNLLGLTKFVQIGPLALTIGVLPYPLTFLCTDLISELYGRKRATWLVWVGFVLNLFVLLVLWVGNSLPPVSPAEQPSWQVISLGAPLSLPNGETFTNEVELFHILYACSAGTILASMVAYLSAQFCDVYVFHFLKKITKGKHFWLRNNLSTMASQLIDTTMVISIAFGAAFMRDEVSLKTIFYIILSGYSFKLLAAWIDTIPAYLLRKHLGAYLRVNPDKEHHI